MATANEITAVRQNTDEPSSTSTFSDVDISALIDENGVDTSSAIVWRRKAATLVSLVNVSEAGASRAYSDLHKNALAMASVYDRTDVVADATITKRAKVHKIVRS